MLSALKLSCVWRDLALSKRCLSGYIFSVVYIFPVSPKLPYAERMVFNLSLPDMRERVRYVPPVVSGNSCSIR